MKLSESQESHDAHDLGAQLVDTSDPHHEGHLGCCGHVDLSREFRSSSGIDLFADGLGMLSLVVLSFLQDLSSLGFVSCSSILSLFF